MVRWHFKERKKLVVFRQIVMKRIRSIRNEKNISQRELANSTGLNVRYISRLESKPQNITLDVLEKLAKGLSCKPSDFFSSHEMTEAPRHSIELFEEAMKLLSRFRSEIKKID